MARVLEFEFWAGRLRGRPRQSLVLTRHFFQRLFQNDVFPFAEQMKEKVYVLLAMIAALGWFLTNSLFSQYMFVEDLGQSWLEKFAFLSFFMIFLALAVVLEWDVLFPDQRDFLNLTPLPVKPGTIVASKFAAFALFVAMYSAAVSALSVFGIAFFLPRWTGDSLRSLAQYGIAHIIAGTAAFIFVFLLMLFLQAVLLAVLGLRTFRAVSLILRFALALTAVVVVILALTDLQNFLGLVGRTREARPGALLAWPPAWFVSMYEILIGRSDPFYTAGANIGLAAILVLTFICPAAMNFGYRRQVKRAGEVRTRTRLWPEARRVLAGWIDRILFRNPVEKAVFHFIGPTLRRSPLHKVRLAGSLAFSLAGLFLIMGLPRTNWSSPRTAGLNVLGAPLVLGFFLLLVFRGAFNVPFTAEANWIFRMTEREDRRPYFLAVKKYIAACFLLPFGIAVAVLHARIWGAGPAALHALYALAWVSLFGEILFWKFARIPFACHVVPGKARLYSRWLPYALAFSLVFGLLTALETALFQSPGKFGGFLAIMGAVIAGLEIFQRKRVYPKLSIVYEEEPEPVMVTL